MVSGWLIALALVNAYILFIVWLVRSGRMEKWNLGLLGGFALMVRTKHGRRSLEWISRPRRFWNRFGDLGVVLAYVGMAGMTVLFLLIVPTVLDPESGVEPLRASEILVIPGVNPFVPLWYGTLALIVTLVVHEGGHGIMSLANRIKLRNLGLLFAVVPIGAFVEPDEEELVAAPRRSRLRVFAAGPTMNFLFAAATLALFASMMGAAAPIPGAPIAGVVEGQPAEAAGITPGDILVSADGIPIAGWGDFGGHLANVTPGATVHFTGHTGAAFDVATMAHWDALDLGDQERILRDEADALRWCGAVMDLGGEETTTGPECAEFLQQKAYVGVRTVPVPIQRVLSEPFGGGGSYFLFTLGLPIGEVRGAPYMSFFLPAFHETPFDADWFWPVATALFWVFWINLMVGLTNVLPLAILDGGHLFRDGLDGLMGRIRPAMEKEARERFVFGIARVMSLVIFTAFLLQIFGPRLVPLFT